MKPKPKQPKSICVSAFPEQFKRLHPERSQAGGIKARSQSEDVRMAVYKPINELYATAHPYCVACHLIWPFSLEACAFHFRDETHHTKGRDGLLLFDVRWFKSVCRKAHCWIHDNPAEAIKLGLLHKSWNVLQDDKMVDGLPH